MNKRRPAVSPDGRRFLTVAVEGVEAAALRIHIVQNWPIEFRDPAKTRWVAFGAEIDLSQERQRREDERRRDGIALAVWQDHPAHVTVYRGVATDWTS